MFRRTGPRLLPPDRSVPFVDLVYRAMEGAATVDQVCTALRVIEERHGVFLRPADEARPYMNAELPQVDAWFYGALFPFLDDTHLVLTGGDFCNDVDLLNRDGEQLGATWRAWGAALAEWANDRGWPTGARLGWGYMDFYMHSPGLERYEEFTRIVRQAIGVSPA